MLGVRSFIIMYLDEHTDTITSCVSFCGESCLLFKAITIYANDKPWFTQDINLLPNRRLSEARTSSGTALPSGKAIRRAKAQ